MLGDHTLYSACSGHAAVYRYMISDVQALSSC